MKQTFLVLHHRPEASLNQINVGGNSTLDEKIAVDNESQHRSVTSCFPEANYYGF